MTWVSVPETIAGFLLVFFVPGYGLARAVFPEWRLRGSVALRRLVELGTLSFVLSIVLTILVGYLLLSVSPSGFQAYWTDPVLEAILFGIAVAALAVAAARGAFSTRPLTPAATRGTGAGEEGAWELTRELDRLHREERRIVHALRGRDRAPADTAALEARLREIRDRSTDLARRREAEYAE